MTKFFFAISLSILLFATTIAHAAVAADNMAPVINGLNKFTFELYHQVSQADQNTVISPYSVSSLLGRLAVGAEGNTRSQMLQVLHIDNSANMGSELNAVDDVLWKNNSCNIWLYCQFTQAPDFLLANAFWADKTITYKKAFLDAIQQDKTVNFYNVDFAHDVQGAKNKINDWVKTNAHGNIETLFPPGEIHPQTRLILTNSIYFKGKWESLFNSKNTQQKAFTLLNGNKIQAPMMMQEEKFNYIENKQLQMLQLGYAKNSLAMAILLPKPNCSLQTIQQTLNSMTFSDLLQKSSPREVEVTLPKFTIDSTFTSLADSIEKIGMVDAFTVKANFSRITDSPWLISGIIQKAKIQVDEEGTAVAAATAVTMFSGAPEPVITFNADHAFLFVIFDRKTNLILFVGQVVNPQ